MTIADTKKRARGRVPSIVKTCPRCGKAELYASYDELADYDVPEVELREEDGYVQGIVRYDESSRNCEYGELMQIVCSGCGARWNHSDAFVKDWLDTAAKKKRKAKNAKVKK